MKKVIRAVRNASNCAFRSRGSASTRYIILYLLIKSLRKCDFIGREGATLYRIMNLRQSRRFIDRDRQTDSRVTPVSRTGLRYRDNEAAMKQTLQHYTVDA